MRGALSGLAQSSDRSSSFALTGTFAQNSLFKDLCEDSHLRETIIGMSSCHSPEPFARTLRNLLAVLPRWMNLFFVEQMNIRPATHSKRVIYH